MKGLLDTSVLIGSEVAGLPDEAAISTASLAELHFGVHLARTDQARRLRLRRLAEIEAHYSAHPIDAEVARAFGELASLTVAAGRKARTRTMDLLIAATARSLGVPLYTKNPKDFQPLADVVDVRPV